jgi:hypothetical protein
MGKTNFWFSIVLSVLVVFALIGCATTTIAKMPAPGKERCVVVFDGGDWTHIDGVFDDVRLGGTPITAVGKTAMSIPAGEHTFWYPSSDLYNSDGYLIKVDEHGNHVRHNDGGYYNAGLQAARFGGRSATYNFEAGKIYTLDDDETITELRSGKVYIGRMFQSNLYTGWLDHGLAGYVGPRLGIGILMGNLNIRIVGKADVGMVFPIPPDTIIFSTQLGGVVEFCSSSIGIGFGGGIITDDGGSSQPYAEVEFLTEGGFGGFFAQYYFGESELLPSIGAGFKFILW